MAGGRGEGGGGASASSPSSTSGVCHHQVLLFLVLYVSLFFRVLFSCSCSCSCSCFRCCRRRRGHHHHHHRIPPPTASSSVVRAGRSECCRASTWPQRREIFARSGYSRLLRLFRKGSQPFLSRRKGRRPFQAAEKGDAFSERRKAAPAGPLLPHQAASSPTKRRTPAPVPLS